VRVVVKESVGVERMNEMLMMEKSAMEGKRRLDIYLSRLLAFAHGCRHSTYYEV